MGSDTGMQTGNKIVTSDVRRGVLDEVIRAVIKYKKLKLFSMRRHWFNIYGWTNCNAILTCCLRFKEFAILFCCMKSLYSVQFVRQK